MEAKAVWKYARVTPFKARAVADLLRGKDLEEAYVVCQMLPRKASEMWRKVIDSAVANLKQGVGDDLDVDQVYLKAIWADKGPAWKRWLPRAQGRATRINKFTSHLSVVIAVR
jgi:large subunit ribosomal protein L22